MKQNLLVKNAVKALFVFVVLLQFSCGKDSTSNTAPTVVTNTIIADLTSTGASSGGVVSSIGSAALTAEGVVYSSTNQTPTLSDSKTTVSTISSGFTSAMTGLTPGTTYYVRAYATNSAGTGYGDAVKFTTTSATATMAAVTTFAGTGTEGLVNGAAASAQFWSPQAIAADPQGNLYVADQFNHVIRKIGAGGVVSTFCGNGTAGHADGAANVAEFYSPSALATDASGNVYVADQGSNYIVKISSAGVATTIAGIGAAGYINSSTATKAAFNNPRGIAVDASGNIFVADAGNYVIRKITPAGVVSTFTGLYSYSGAIDGANTAAEFGLPCGLAFDSKGVLYVADYNNHLIRKVASDGTVSSYVGNISETTFLGNPVAIAFDSADNLIIADATGRVLKFNGTVLYTLAGTINTYGFADASGESAQFNQPLGVAVVNGTVYVADYNNSRIRKITGIQ